MSQLYLQRFEYRAAAKADFEQTWQTALQTFAKAGNWGVEAGVRHIKSYGTAWGGYVLIEVDVADAFGRNLEGHCSLSGSFTPPSCGGLPYLPTVSK